MSAQWRAGSVSGVLMGTDGGPMEGESGEGRWCGSVDEVVVVGHCPRKREAGEGAEGQKTEIEPLGLDFGGAVGNGGG